MNCLQFTFFKYIFAQLIFCNIYLSRIHSTININDGIDLGKKNVQLKNIVQWFDLNIFDIKRVITHTLKL